MSGMNGPRAATVPFYQSAFNELRNELPELEAA